MWCGLLTTARPLPAPLRTLFSPRTLAAVLMRYQQGTLRYNEFALASLMRRGHHIGMWVHYIWVDSRASLWGGRQIWGLPKQMAEFTWADHHVHITDAAGQLAALSLIPRAQRGPVVPIRLGGFGHANSTLLLATATARGRIRPASIKVTAWADHLPQLARTSAHYGLVVAPIRITAHAPKHLGPLPSPPADTPSPAKPRPTERSHFRY
ncbi:acetoacetate decarboxylase family protein [Streptomyces luteireticuli]|uniref:acetoacetate decarboxylase family protein n=1 Tax=Streptomyces luteireticuli TaxID=173858 RepID=UPI0035581B28